MSHLHERKEKICLNCQTEVVGRYCHKCGQENLEPQETVWHLVQHFFNDITHFDGKFFETVKDLIRRPGFLSLEYMRGRRAAYLNPVRMYVFTSAIFFIILYSLSKPEDMARGLKNDKAEEEAPVTMTLAALKSDTARLSHKIADAEDEDDKEDFRQQREFRHIEIVSIRKAYGDTSTRAFNKGELDGFLAQAYTDSIASGNYDLPKKSKFRRAMRNFSKHAQNGEEGSHDNWNIFGYGIDYANVEQYDSTEKALPVEERDGWFKHFVVRRGIIIQSEYHEDKRLFVEHLLENIMHSFPKILWISLPIFAMLLNILYFRHKKYYYVSHGIFTIHVYCATFIQLFLWMILYLIGKAINVHWVSILIGLLEFAIFLWMIIYLYKAMRGFYQQRRAKTFLKYFIVMWTMFWINIILLVLFLLISVFSV